MPTTIRWTDHQASDRTTEAAEEWGDIYDQIEDARRSGKRFIMVSNVADGNRTITVPADLIYEFKEA